MQLAGNPCRICSESVLVAGDARGCLKCNVVWHKACAENPDECPFCHQRVDKVERDVMRQRESASAHKIAQGKMVYLVVLILRLAFDGIALSISLTTGGELNITQLAGTVLFPLLWGMAFVGYRRARYLLGALALLGCVLAGFMLAFSNISRLPLITTIVVNVVTLWACFGSSSVKFLEESKNGYS